MQPLASVASPSLEARSGMKFTQLCCIHWPPLYILFTFEFNNYLQLFSVQNSSEIGIKLLFLNDLSSSPSFQHSVVDPFSPYSTGYILSPGHWWPSIDGPASHTQCKEDTWWSIVVGSGDECRFALCWRNRDGQVERWSLEL